MISYREFCRELESLGCEFIRQKGSHRMYKHPKVEELLVIPVNGKKVNKFIYKKIKKVLVNCGV